MSSISADNSTAKFIIAWDTQSTVFDILKYRYLYSGNVVDFFQSSEDAECMSLECLCKVFIDFIPAWSDFRAIEQTFPPLTGREEIQPWVAAEQLTTAALTAFSSSQDAHHFRRTSLCKTRPRVLFAVVPQLSKQFRLQLFPSTLIL